jgi:hypothetical protein
MNTLNKTISVIEPVNEALERTRTILFAPFNLEKWFIIGFCAWLSGLFRETAGGGFNYKFNNGGAPDKFQIPAHALEFYQTHIILIASAVIAAVILFTVIMLVLLWLSSRGKFMFLDCLAKNKAHVIEPWKTFKKQANGLLGFRLLIIAAALICITPVGILIVWLSSFVEAGTVNVVIAGMVFFAMLLLAFLVISFIGLVQSLTFDFVVPIMYLQRTGVFAAWGKFLPLLRQNFWKIMLYLLFKVLILFCMGAIALFIIGLACCCCCIGVVLLIPYIGTVILLPLLSFYRLYSLCYLRQFGSEYDVFAAGL